MNQDSYVEVPFALAGIAQDDAFARQKPKQMPNGEWGRTCVSGQNVRSYDGADRLRGGRRPGLAKYTTDRGVGDFIVQEIAVITTIE